MLAGVTEPPLGMRKSLIMLSTQVNARQIAPRDSILVVQTDFLLPFTAM